MFLGISYCILFITIMYPKQNNTFETKSPNIKVDFAKMFKSKTQKPNPGLKTYCKA